MGKLKEHLASLFDWNMTGAFNEEMQMIALVEYIDSMEVSIEESQVMAHNSIKELTRQVGSIAGHLHKIDMAVVEDTKPNALDMEAMASLNAEVMESKRRRYAHLFTSNQASSDEVARAMAGKARVEVVKEVVKPPEPPKFSKIVTHIHRHGEIVHFHDSSDDEDEEQLFRFINGEYIATTFGIEEDAHTQHSHRVKPI